MHGFCKVKTLRLDTSLHIPKVTLNQQNSNTSGFQVIKINDYMPCTQSLIFPETRKVLINVRALQHFNTKLFCWSVKRIQFVLLRFKTENGFFAASFIFFLSRWVFYTISYKKSLLCLFSGALLNKCPDRFSKIFWRASLMEYF